MMQAGDTERRRLARLREAGEWLLRLQDGRPGGEAVEAWLRWCDEHPENFNAFQRLQHGWQDLDALKPYARALRGSAPLRPQIPQRRKIGWAFAAGLAAVAAALVWWKSAAPPAEQLTAALTNRAATLPDGSRMILGAQSRVDMRFEGSRRQLDLSQGEAYFKVKHDRSRPFVVRAGEVSVQAIGTAFDVRRGGDGTVTVTVEEGAVEVSSAPKGLARTSWRAQAGYRLTYSARERSASLASVNAAAELAWRRGELAYMREPLTSVVEDFNACGGQKVVLADARVAALRFTGTAFPSAVRDWATGITQIYPVEARTNAAGDIVLSWRRSDSTENPGSSVTGTSGRH